MKNFIVFTCLTLILSSSLFAESKKLRYIIDGDTVVFKHSTCRLAYIDTPESKRNKKAIKDISHCPSLTMQDIIESGRYARRYLKHAMKKGKKYEVTVLSKDIYSRDICVIHSSRDTFNYDLVRNGFAVPFWRYITSHAIKVRMEKALLAAKSQQKGLWRTHPHVMECMNVK